MTQNEIIEINKRYFMARNSDGSWSVYDREALGSMSIKTESNPHVKLGPIQANFKKVFDNGTIEECKQWVARNGEEAA